MRKQALRWGSLVACLHAGSAAVQAQDLIKKLSDDLMFHASFDQGSSADFAKGDSSLYHSSAMDQRESAKKDLPPDGNITLQPKSGRFGGAIQFHKEKGPIVFYRAAGNFPESTPSWGGTVSFWLQTDPKGDLKEGFCDPIQITSKQWDDAAFFVEFEKRSAGIPFRLGVYADKAVWNPTGRKFESIPANERPLTTVESPPFAAGKWTHVAFTFDKFNGEGSEASAVLYLDGEKAGMLTGRRQVFSWDTKKAAIMLGLSYVGLMDDLATFRRALGSDEIRQLYSLEKGVASLRHTK